VRQEHIKTIHLSDPPGDAGLQEGLTPFKSVDWFTKKNHGQPESRKVKRTIKPLNFKYML
jgi:hypothetical protein